jgi:hypothetical protein
LLFAGLLAIQLVASLLRLTDQRSPATDRQRVVDRPADAQPAPNPPRTPFGRSLIRRTESMAKAG